MSTLENIIIATFFGSIIALVGGVILLSNEKLALKFSHLLASFAAGILLGAAFLDLLPEALHESEGSNLNIPLWVLVGIIIFFFIERFIHWFHHHEEHPEHLYHQKESKNTVPLIVIGDTVHNFIDGVVIAATFSIDTSLGIVSTLAVIAHEIPQEIGDFGLLLHKGLKKKKIIVINLISALAAFLGAGLAYFSGSILDGYLPVFLAITAGFFIYIATSDLIPEIHYETRKNFAIIESCLLILGIVVILISTSFLEH